MELKGKITIGFGDVQLRETINNLVESGKKNILINMQDVTTIDSSGIGELVGCYTSVTNKGGKLKLLHLPPKINDVLTVTQLITVFDVYESEPEALASFAAKSRSHGSARRLGRPAFDGSPRVARLALERALSRACRLPPPRGARFRSAIEDAVLSPGKRLRPLVALAAGEIVRAPGGRADGRRRRRRVRPRGLARPRRPALDGRCARAGAAGRRFTSCTASPRRSSRPWRSSREPSRSSRRRRRSPARRARDRRGARRGRRRGRLLRRPGRGPRGRPRERSTLDDLEAIHARKTGALFVAAVRGGALAGGAGEAALEALTLYARNLGLAFQITDDLLDLQGDPERDGQGHAARRAPRELRDAPRSGVLPPARRRAPRGGAVGRSRPLGRRGRGARRPRPGRPGPPRS